MKLKTLRAVHVDLPVPRPKTPARRAPWPESSPRAMPINYYPQFSRQPQDMPGNVGLSEVWVQAIAEDGTFGLGKCSFGQPVASYIDHVIAPVLEGQNCMAIELMNDLVNRGGHRHGLAGIVATALAGVDIALWDLKGKLLDRPVYEILGGPVRDRIPALRHRRRPRLVPRTRLYALQDHQSSALFPGR